MRRLLAALTGLVLWAAPAAAERMMLPVPARTLFPGHALSQDDFSLVLFEVSPAARQAYVTRLGDLENMAATRGLQAGKPVARAAIGPLEHVRRGRLAKASFRLGGLSIEGTLLPLAAGVEGDVIEARNPATGKVVRALVRRDGTLEVMPE